MRIGKLVAWESWARFVMRAGTGHSSADHREVRTALSLSLPAIPLGQALVWFFMESNLQLRVAEREAGYYLLFAFFVNCRSHLFL